ncbi:PAS domain S-box protein [Eubacterium sp. MSJ-13]|uniref:sensor histidine kinase n=1 Tax=Eubacterium sp. MSJ-13 TaxID=2841513 RepID=UPI001C11CEB8|nr:ATP-binding protein [Eubacterium sp. MSJ-13]MBU5477989.1 PAS domain S-box protein [Eubacterium sp. MSJ-13]
MTKKIFKSVLLVAVVMVLFCCTFILGILYRHFTVIEEEQLESQLGFVVTGVENQGEDYLKNITEKKYRITWVEADGTVRYDNKTDASKMENHADRKEIKDALKFGRGESSRYSSTLTQKTIYYAKKINDGSVVRISVSQDTVFKLLFSMISAMVITIIIAVILSSILAREVSKKVVEPLNNLDFNEPLKNDAYGEIAPLLRHIEHQHRQIDEQLEELQKKKDEFQATIENMDEGLILLDAKNNIISINPAAKKIFGATDECLGKDFLVVERNLSVGNTIKEAMEKGKAEMILKRYGLDYQLGVSKIESAGKTLGAVLLAVDVTEKNNAERIRREFSANVSHELKTPLQSIIGSAELMENNLVKEEDMPRFVGHIRKEAERLVKLVEDIIRLSWLDENRDMEMELVDLRDIADETKEALENTAKEKNVTINVSGENIKLHGVRSLLYEIVYNLCENGIKYNKEGGKVDITLSKEAGKDILVVEDTGIGIKEEQQSRIFERFYRVDKSRSKETGGTGLGLSIVKHAAMYHNADVTLESTEGQGSKFTVIFPREE